MINMAQVISQASTELAYTAQGFADMSGLDELGENLGNFKAYMSKALQPQTAQPQDLQLIEAFVADEEVPETEVEIDNQLQKLFATMTKQKTALLDKSDKSDKSQAFESLADSSDEEEADEDETQNMELLALLAQAPQPQQEPQTQAPIELTEIKASIVEASRPKLHELEPFRVKYIDSFKRPEQAQGQAKPEVRESAKVEAEVPKPTEAVEAKPEQPAKAPQAEQAKQVLPFEVKTTSENQDQDPQKTQLELNFPKAVVQINAKPEEMAQLLERFNAINSETTEDVKAESLTAEPTEAKAQVETNKPKATEKETGEAEKGTGEADKTTQKETGEADKASEQTFKAQGLSYEPKATVVEETKATLPSSQIARIGEAIARQSTAKDGVTTLEMTLNPAELGKISIKLTVKNAIVTAEITAEKAKTATLLQNVQDKIIATAEKGDVKFESVTIEHKPDYSEQRQDNQQNRQGREQSNDQEAEVTEDGISFSELMASM